MIPDWMPTLSRGSHSNPKEGACVMEYISFIKGEKWGDSPECTAPYIADMARNLNDAIKDDEERSRLLIPLLPKIMACAPIDGTQVVFTTIADHLGLPKEVPTTVLKDGEFVQVLKEQSGYHRIEAYIYTFEDNYEKRAALFEVILDEYISYYGITVEQVEDAEYAATTARLLAPVL